MRTFNMLKQTHSALIKVLLITTLMLSTTMAHAGWPKIATPPLTETTSLAQELLYQGTPMRVKTFTSKVSKSRVVNFYRDRWEKEYVVDYFGPWKQISHKHGNYFVTIQVQASGESSSYGRISVMQIPDEDEHLALGKGIATLPDTTVLNDITSNDKKTNSRNILAQNKQSIESNGHYYKTHYANNNWGSVMDKTVNPDNRVLIFRKGRKETVVVIQRIADTSYIQINESEKTGWFK